MSKSTKQLTMMALLMAMTIALSTFSIPVPGGHLYFVDFIICLTAFLLPPKYAAFVAGGGSFLGDVFFNPPSMFVTLLVHGFQAYAISSLVGTDKDNIPKWRAIGALLVGGVIMVVGYSLGRAYFYSTPAYALMKLPFECIQALFGIVLSFIVYYSTPIAGEFRKHLR